VTQPAANPELAPGSPVLRVLPITRNINITFRLQYNQSSLDLPGRSVKYFPFFEFSYKFTDLPPATNDG
jgi:hypothetical protein